MDLRRISTHSSCVSVVAQSEVRSTSTVTHRRPLVTAKSFIQKARNNEGFMFGTRRRENEHQKNARISQQIYSVSTPQKVRFKKQSVASSLRNNFSVVPKVSLQKKLDYYFSPYNPKLTFKRYMRFDEEEASNKEDLTESKQKNGEWKFLANFLLNEDLQTFRMACKQINKRFYNKLSTFSKSLKERGMKI